MKPLTSLQYLLISVAATQLASVSNAAEIKRANSSGGLNSTTRWVGGVVPGPGDMAVWDNTVSTVANCTNGLGASLSWAGIKILDPSAPPKINFTSGLTLSLGASGINVADAANTRDLFIEATTLAINSQSWNIKSGRIYTYGRALDVNDNTTITINNTGTIQGSGGANCIMRVGAGSIGTATVNQSAGTHICNQSGGVPVIHIGKFAGNIGVYNLTGGVLDCDDVAGSIINVGDTAGCDGRLNVSGGQVFGSVMRVGNSGSGILTISNTGAVTLVGNLIVPNVAGGTGIVNLDGGTLTVPKIVKVGGIGTFNFNGGTLFAAATDTAFFQGLDQANVKEGGARIDTAGFDVTIAQTLLHGGLASVDGGLVKSGVGTATLSGANTYNGAALVNAGKLVTSTAHTGGGSITVADGAALGVTVAAAGTILNSSAVALGSSSGVTGEFNLAGFGNPSAPVLFATNLTAQGTVTINISGSGLSVGQFPLIKYSGAIGGGGFAAFTVGTLPPGVTASLVNNTGNSSIDLNITVAPKLIWTAAINSNWDIGTTNWLDSFSASAVSYTDGYPVFFDDSAASGAVQITTSVSPGGVTVSNNSLAYSFNGAGSVISGGLTKNGSGTLTLNTAQNYTGDTVVNSGKLAVGLANAVPGGAGKGNVTINGTLDLAGFANAINGLSGSGTIDSSTGAGVLDLGNNSANAAFSGTLQNSGGSLAISKNGTGTATLSGNNTFSGGTTIAGGTVQVGHDNALGTGLVQMGAFTLCSDGAAARTIPNSFLVTGGAVFGSPVNTGTITLAGSLDFNAAARNLTINNDVVFSGSLTNGNINKLGTGNLILKGTVTTLGDSEVRIGQLIIDGANVTSAGGFRPDASLNSGQARLILTNGGILTQTSTTANIRSGYDANVTATNYFDVAGTMRMPNAGTGSARMILGPGCARGVLNLLPGGDVEVSAVVPADANTGSGAASELNLNGGILRPKASNTSFMQGLTEVNIRDGGAIFDTSGFDITVAQSLLNGGSGGLTKNGVGTLTLTGTNTYVGATVVNGGKLVVTPAQSGGGALTVNDGATANVKLVSPGTSFNASTVTLGDSAGATIEFNLAALSNPTAPVLSSTTLITHGAVTVNVSGAGLSVGQFHLIRFTEAIQGSGYGAFTLGSLPPGVIAVLVGNPGGFTSYIDLNVTAVAPVLWSGANNGDWDIDLTANWTINASPITYQEPAVPGPAVRFDDTASGTPNVNLTTTLSPASVTVSNLSLAYGFSGSGKISGPASLTKQGAGTLTVATPNDYTGATLISAGKLTLRASDVLPNGTGKSDVTVNGTLDLAGNNETVNGLTGNGLVDVSSGASTLTLGGNNVSTTFSGTIANSGGTLALVKTGTGSIALSGNNTYSGGTTIPTGTGSIAVGHNNALGTGLVTMSGGSLSSDSTTARSLNNAFQVLSNSTLGNATSSGVLTLNGSFDFRFDYNASSRLLTCNSDMILTGALTNGAFNKEGNATLTTTGYADFNSGAEVRRGTWIVNGGAITNTDSFRPDVNLGASTARLVVTNGGAIILTGTGVNGRVGYTGGDPTMTNILDLAGTFRMPNADTANGTMTIGRNGMRGILNLYSGGDLMARQVSKSTTGTGQYGELNFDGGILRAANDQTAFITGLDLISIRSGGAIIDSGTFSITIAQSLLGQGGNDGGVTKIGSGTLFLNGTNTYTGTTVVSNGTFGGTGSFISALAIQSGATLSPGNNNIGTLTLLNGLLLNPGSTTTMEVNKTTGTNDFITSSQAIYGGTLNIVNLGDTLTAGDSFKLFNATIYNSVFSAITPATPAAGLVWDTSQLTVSGTLRVALSVATNPTNITAVVSGGNMDLMWPEDHIGWRLESQTNSINVGITTNWFTVSGSASTNRMVMPINSANDTVFFRLVYP